MIASNANSAIFLPYIRPKISSYSSKISFETQRKLLPSMIEFHIFLYGLLLGRHCIKALVSKTILFVIVFFTPFHFLMDIFSSEFIQLFLVDSSGSPKLIHFFV